MVLNFVVYGDDNDDNTNEDDGNDEDHDSYDVCLTSCMHNKS